MKVCLVSTAVAILVALLLFLLSFSSLEYTEIGINYSFFSSDIEYRGYGAGRYLLGLGHSFIKFPSTVQSISFSPESDAAGPPLRSRTSDGLEVALEVSFQFQFNTTTVVDLYQKYGVAYEPIYVNMAMDLISATATQFNATTFFNDRTKIGFAMEKDVRAAFETQAFATVPFFQLRAVTLPTDFEAAIQQTEVKKQDIQTAEAEKENKKVEMDTQVLQAQQQAIQIGFNANATAQRTLLFVQAYVEQFKLSQQYQADTFSETYEKLGKNESLLLDYMRIRALRDHPDHLTVVSVPPPHVTLNPP